MRRNWGEIVVKVLVFGAGVVGTAAAYYLNRAGHEVTVIERNQGAGLETSFANGGIVSAFTARPWATPEVPRMLFKWFGRQDAPYLFRLRPDWSQWSWALRFLGQCTRRRFEQSQAVSLRLSTYSYGCLQEVRDSEQIQYDQRTDGVLHLFQSQQQLDAEAAAEMAHADSRFHPEAIGMRRAVEIEPALAASAGGYAGALYFAQDESGDAYKFTAALAAAAERHGATFRYGVAVRRLQSENGRIQAVDTDQGRFEADAYVMSLGSFSPLILRKIGIRVPIYPLKGYSVTIPTGGHQGAPGVAIHEGSRRIVMCRIGDRLRAAGTAELTGYDLSISPTRTQAILDVTMALFPDCGDAAKAERWAGLRPMTPDCLPILGRTRYTNLYMDTGHGSTGWTYACGSGRIIADMISGKQPDIDLAGLTADRF
ncbi:MAG: D-amino acid dehydrogenase [Alphaproteobacteria bacterium]|jgi:D-amino-acid dehydrogenase|nr:D-amino acid dehydrogenase [Alphaproteobacteria bacterium]MDP6587975.1 D-amino acid dehydrogenase [Alphaproteobacteria bacterium]MDP6817794.1 D-amino acid dehydrogenase [Alphaproteobacteria bacterium]